MKISQIRKKLEEIEKECGDLEFVVMTEVDGRFCIEYGRDVDAIQPDGEGEFVCAALNFGEDQVEEAE